MKYVSSEKFLCLFFLVLVPLFSQAQEKRISGKVTDAETGDNLPGVNILIKGSTIGTTTDATGSYQLVAENENAVLVFSFIGYATTEVAVRNQTTINLALALDVKSLEEIVVVGYGTQKKADLTGSVGGIRGDDIGITSKPVTSAEQVMAGRIAGVNISNRSGDPGAPITVRIRGVGTTGSNQPLWVIDGVPIVQTSNITVNTSSTTESNPLAGINPSDIESIDVLKDASASAIYGARAANGVVIVTTKRGKEGKASFTYDGYTGIAEARNQLDMLNVDQYIDIQAQLGRDLSQFRGQPNVDWQDAVFRTATFQSHNLTVSGGSANANYSIGGGYVDQEGIELAQGFKRYSIKANSDINVGKRFKFGESLLLSLVNRKTQSEDALFGAFTASQNAPYFKIFDPSGPFGFNPENVTTVGANGFGQNLVMRLDPRVNETKIDNKKVLFNIYGELEIIKGLKYKISGGVDYNEGGGDFFQEAVAFDNISKRSSLLVQERGVEFTTNLTHTLTYTKTFGKHSFTFLAGEEETNFRFDKVRVQGTNLFNTQIRFPSTGTNVAAANEADHWALRGYLGRMNYAFGDKYLFTVNIRNDNSSRFAKGNRSQTFPAFSAGWRISEEPFFAKGGFFDDVKLRASWGKSGNQFTGSNFAFQSTLQTTIFYVAGTGQSVVRGPAPIIFANDKLKWETSTQTDIGADVSLLQGKVDLTFDYYNKTTKDVLIGLPIPFTSGFFLPVDANVGEILNRGVEVALSYNNTIGKLHYSIGGNITTVHNEVQDLGASPPIITGMQGAQTHRTIAGEPLGHFFGFKTDGIYQTQSEVDADQTVDVFSSGRAPGDIRFVDVSGPNGVPDGVIDALDRTKLGSSIPSHFYGITLSAEYNGFDLSVLLQGVGGVQVYNQARSVLESLSGNNNFTTRTLGFWNGPGTSNSMPRLSQQDPNGNNRFSDRWIEDANFMRIRNIQIGYAIPATILQNWTKGNITKFRVYVAAQNLATFTSYLGYDPEVTRGFSFQKGDFALANGQDSGSSPQPRVFQFGWQVTF